MIQDAIDRQPRRRGRFGLFLPFILVGLALAGWTVWWFVIAQRVEAETDRAAAALRAAGYEVSWSNRSVQGWPFRTFVRFGEFRIAAPSGHALKAPALEAEANSYDLGRWVAAAPQGIVLTRADKGDVAITGEAIRASIAGVATTPPRIVIELRKAVFTPAAGAEPFPIARADLVDLHIRPTAGQAGSGDFLFRVQNAAPRADGMLDWIGEGRPFSTQWEGRATAVDRFAGRGWVEAARAWSLAGGRLTTVSGVAETGPAKAEASAPLLSIGPDGRLRGALSLKVTGAPRSLAAMGRAHAVDPVGAGAAAAATAVAGGLDGTATIRLDFTDEGSMIGPIRLSGSPQVF